MAVQDLRAIAATWLKDAIAREGISPEDLARRAKLAKSTVYRLLAGDVQPEESTIRALMHVLVTPFPQIRALPERPIKSDKAAPGRPASERSAGKGGLAREAESAHNEHREGAEEPGWGFGDPSEAEESARTSLRHIERTHRAMVSDPAAFSADDVRQLQLASARAFMRQYELSAKAVPDWLHRIHNELIEGTFR